MKMSFTYLKPGGQIEVRAELDKQLRRLFTYAIGEALVAAVSAMAVDSGMAASSFVPLAREFRAGARLQAMIRGAYSDRGYLTSPKEADYVGTYGPAGKKSKTHGYALGTNAYLYTTGGYNSGIYNVSFEIAVLQHAIHEGRWRSLHAAETAFAKAVREAGNRYLDGESLMRLIVGLS